MRDMMGIIDLSEKDDNIKEITLNRPIATVPIGGRYRIIDFVLSNIVNTGIQNVSIFTEGKINSLTEHIGSGKEWYLDRKNDGLFIFNSHNNLSDSPISKGNINNFINNIDYIKRSKQKYVVIAKSNMICNINYQEVYKYHKDSNSDITIIYKKIEKNNEEFLDCDILNLDNEQKVMSIGKNIGNNNTYNVSMEMYIMKKKLFLEIIENSISMGNYTYLKEVIYNNVDNLHINGYCFDGYVKCINSIENYYKTNIEMLDINVYNELFYKNGSIYTKLKDDAPTKYREESNVTNSIVSNGCVIEGIVENSIIGRGVKIKKGATIKNSIIMQNSIIEEDVDLTNVVLDKNVHIGKNNTLIGDLRKPLVIKKNSIVQ